MRKVVSDVPAEVIFLRLHHLSLLGLGGSENGRDASECHFPYLVAKDYYLADFSLQKTLPNKVRIQIAKRD